MNLLKSFPRGYSQLGFWYTGPMTDKPEIKIDQIDPQKFALTVLFEAQSFDCGTYISRMAAVQAGKLFAERKEGEREGRKKRPKGKR